MSRSRQERVWGRAFAAGATSIALAGLFFGASAADAAPDREQKADSGGGGWVRSSTPSGGGIAGDVPGSCGSTTFNQNASAVPGPGVYCGGSSGSSAFTAWARAFSILPTAPAIINCVDFGVDECTGGAHTVTVNILTGNPTGPYAALTLLGSVPVTIPDATFGALVKADFVGAGAPVVVPAGSTMIVEIESPTRDPLQGGDGGVFGLGANSDGQSGPSYIRAQDCGNADFLDMAGIGFPNVHLVIRADAGALFWTAIDVLNNSGQAAADLHLTFTGTGGTVVVPPGMVIAPGCPPNPAVPSNGQVTNTVVIEWPGACVPPGGSVLFLLGTPFAPIGFAGGFWTDVNGANIGNIAPSRVTINGPIFNPGNPLINGLKPFWTLKRQIRYRGTPVYSAWAKPPGQCWQRWCCFGPGQLKCYDRYVLCRFPDLITRFLELIGPGSGNCRLLRGWKKFFENDVVVWILIVTTIPPEPWELQDPPGGPPPEKPLVFAPGPDEEDLVMNRIEVHNSNDNGETSQPSADFASSFFDIFIDLGIPTNNPALPPIVGFNNLAMAMAPRYHIAAEDLAPLETELQLLTLQGAHPLVPQMLNNVQQIRNNLHLIANGLAMGLPNNATPYFQTANHLQQLGNAAFTASGGSLQYQHANGALVSMAEGMQTSGQMVLTGLPGPVQQDTFLWGQVARFRQQTEFFAKYSLPHVQLSLDLQLPSWGPETGQVHLVVRNAEDPLGEALIHGNEHIDEYGHVVLSEMELGDATQLNVWVKGPTNIAASFDVPNDHEDQGPVVTLLNGDANGDNCIDFDDADYVMATMGMGGEFAPTVPSSDVNRDGVVSFEDLMIVSDNLGNCGPAEPYRCIGDADHNGVVDGGDITVVLGLWLTGGPDGDLNYDGIVNGGDITVILGSWGPCPVF